MASSDNQASSNNLSPVDRIGQAAGLVWQALNEKCPLSFTQLAKEVDAPKDLVVQAIGWLAREGKIDIQEKGRQRTVSLK